MPAPTPDQPGPGQAADRLVRRAAALYLVIGLGLIVCYGYLLARPEALFGEVPLDNPYLRLANEAPKRENPAVQNDNDKQG